MKHFTLTLIISAALCGPAMAQMKLPDPNAPKIMFTGGTAFDCGAVKQNLSVTHTFEFTNQGKQPLVISSVTSSCNCIVPGYSKDPVQPGQKGTVQVKLSTKDLKGAFSKDVDVRSNAAAPLTTLVLRGTVN